MEPATPSLGDLREENENLRKEVEALLRAREIAKDKVRVGIQKSQNDPLVLIFGLFLLREPFRNSSMKIDAYARRSY